ncbi:hypothetical protein [Actinoplanes sp. N902-109]|uniref:hypothetical protein n=1 Tax=Actinoplanes sp. (strain N902-109) TaxID=649831 RepID=UPI0005A2D0B0|nr:hypothetical protein [Actinoplanes sp. N902-109]
MTERSPNQRPSYVADRTHNSHRSRSTGYGNHRAHHLHRAGDTRSSRAGRHHADPDRATER